MSLWDFKASALRSMAWFCPPWGLTKRLLIVWCETWPCPIFNTCSYKHLLVQQSFQCYFTNLHFAFHIVVADIWCYLNIVVLTSKYFVPILNLNFDFTSSLLKSKRVEDCGTSECRRDIQLLIRNFVQKRETFYICIGLYVASEN